MDLNNILPFGCTGVTRETARLSGAMRKMHHIRCRTSEKPLRAPENKFNNLQDQHVR